MSSQDYSRNIHFPSSQDYFQKLTPASLDRGIPLTPFSGSAAMQNDLSSSWSSQSYSQQTPRSYSKNFIGKQSNAKDTLFLNEIRFCLHAVLSVVRDLPEKLRLLVTNSCKTKDGIDNATIEKEKKLLEEKLALLESTLSLSEKSFENSLETKKFQESLLLGLNEVPSLQGNQVFRCSVQYCSDEMENNFESFQESDKATDRNCISKDCKNVIEEFGDHVKCVIYRACISRPSLSYAVQKYVASNGMEFNALKENFSTKNTVLTKYLTVTKKSCLGRMAEIKTLLESFKSSITSLRVDGLDIKIQGLVDDVKNVYLMLNADEKLVNILITQEKENANKLDKLFKEVAVMKCAIENLPCNISSIIKRELSVINENTNAKQNIRLPEPVSGPGINKYFSMTKKFPKYSPVARVVPRIQGVSLNPGDRAYHSLQSEKYETCVCRNSDSKFQSSLKLIEFENSNTQDLPVVNFTRPLKRKLGCSAYSTPDQDCFKVLRRQ